MSTCFLLRGTISDKIALLFGDTYFAIEEWLMNALVWMDVYESMLGFFVVIDGMDGLIEV